MVEYVKQQARNEQVQDEKRKGQQEQAKDQEEHEPAEHEKKVQKLKKQKNDKEAKETDREQEAKEEPKRDSSSQFEDDGSSTDVPRGYGYGNDWPTAPQPGGAGDTPAASAPAAGGCKAGSVVTTVMGSAVVIDNSIEPSKTPYKATAECMGEPTNTYQYGGTCELSCTEASDYGRVVNTLTSISTGGDGQTVCGALRFSSKKVAGICSIIPVALCCEPATSSSS